MKPIYPSSTITVPFGWDSKTFPDAPRIHHAIDRALPDKLIASKGFRRGDYPVFAPCNFDGAAWIDADATGSSVLRLIKADGAELRILHFIKAELFPGVARAIGETGISEGAPIGPAGNQGLSVSKTGGDGRHIHYSWIIPIARYTSNALDRKYGERWRVSETKKWNDLYGEPFRKDLIKRGISSINADFIIKTDPYIPGNVLIVNSYTIMGL
jgi:hypothetical protein